jgi:addiction module HigA family antidote
MKKSIKSLRNVNRRPTHPGEILREDVLPALGITQAVFATHLGVSRLTVSEVLHEKRGISAEMAVRIARVIGGTPQSWLHMQEAVDIWEVEQKFQQNPESAPTAIAPLALAA